ncbi:hypothetical protein EG68_04451 [Paragonimus skrjabini miyazakii]|uniref:Uncharacterized protein n=1 Tax=Paragonimus skrjabini miyazakii TaxID=59628 RepID=A0A8S9Z778_9TREM|nr:hypothetical protein EG68_04451 [Paragonimus skrjabini miyazakii]
MHPSKVYDEEIVRQTTKNKLEQLIRSTQMMLKSPKREAFTKTERELINSEEIALINDKQDLADFERQLEVLSNIVNRVDQRFEDRRAAEAALQQTLTTCQNESQQEHLKQAQREQLELLHRKYMEDFKGILASVSDSDSDEHIQQVTEHMWLLQKNLERQLNNITPAPEPLLQLSKETAEENTRLFHKKRLRRLTCNLKHQLAGPLNDFATDNEKKAIDWLGSVLERTDSDSVYYERQYQDLEATAKTIENRFISRSKANEAFQNALNNCYIAMAKMNIHEPGCQPLSPTKKRQLQSLYYDYKTQFQDLSNPSFAVTQSGEIRHRTQEIEELRENLDKDWKKMCTEPANSNAPSPSYTIKTPSETDMFHLHELVRQVQTQMQGPYKAFITELEQNGLVWVTSNHKRDDLGQAECDLQREAMSDIMRLVKKRFSARVQAKEALRVALLEKRRLLEHVTSRVSRSLSINEAAHDQLQAIINKYQSTFDGIQMTNQSPSLLSVIEDQTNYIVDIVEKFEHDWNLCFEGSLKQLQEESVSATALEISRLEAKSKLAEVTSDLQRKLSEQPFAWYATTREKAGLEWIQSALSNKEAEQSYYERQTQVLLVTEDLIRQRMDERTRAIQLLTTSFQLCKEALDQTKAKSKRNVDDRLHSILRDYQSASEALQQNACQAESADDIELITQSLEQLHQKFIHDWTVQSGDVMESTNSQTAHMVNGSCVTDLKSSPKLRQLADLIDRLEQKVRDTATPFITPLEKMGLRGIQAGLNRDEPLDTERVHRQLDALHELASTIICREIARQNAKEEFQKALVEFRRRLFKMTVHPLNNTVDQLNRIQQTKSICANCEDRFERLQALEGPPKNDVNIASLTKAFQDLCNELWIKWNEAAGEVDPSAISGIRIHHTNEAFKSPIYQTVLTLKHNQSQWTS